MTDPERSSHAVAVIRGLGCLRRAALHEVHAQLVLGCLERQPQGRCCEQVAHGHPDAFASDARLIMGSWALLDIITAGLV